VHVFLAVFVVTGVAHQEVWPFTGFRLFSELRPAVVDTWQVVAVEGGGDEVLVRLSALPVAYRTTARQIDDFANLTADERDDVCDAWVSPLRRDGVDVAKVRVYSKRIDVRPDGQPPARRLVYECGTAR
jgi:hypothetical protein